MKSLCIRIDEADKTTIAATAKGERLSINAFVVRAALAACNGRAQQGQEPDLGPEAEDALAALTATGLTPKEAEAKVVKALRDNPQATADEIMAAAFGKPLRERSGR